jgi:predicted DNA binding CopG/RHH family protein
MEKTANSILQINFRLTKKLKHKIDTYCFKKGLKRQRFITEAVETFLTDVELQDRTK